MDLNKHALKKFVAGPLGIGRKDNKSFVKLRSPRLTSGQIAGEMIRHIDDILAKGTTLRMHDDEISSHAIAVTDISITGAEKTELQKYKKVLAFFKDTTAFEFRLDIVGIQNCLNENDFCVIHGNFPKDAHSEAVLLAKTPLQLMHLNNLNEEKRPVPESESQQLVGGNKLQWNKLYVFPSLKRFEQALQILVQNYNTQCSLYSENDARSTDAALADELTHGANTLYQRQFTRPPIGYGCEFKTVDDMQDVILSSDLRTKIQMHLQALAALAMKEKNLVRGQPILEEQIWSLNDFPKKNQQKSTGP